MRVGIVAGEASGDLLAAGLIKAMRDQHGDLEIEGVAGPALEAVGCQVLAPMSELAVMGITEVVAELPRLLALRRRLRSHWLENPPDVFIGVDAPDFNLGLETRLKRAGIRTVHYVSPTVWAWRPGRVKSIARAADLVLCLYPFEPQCYAQVPVRAEFVGHPFAEEIASEPERAQARDKLGLGVTDQVVAVLPGSRHGELARLGGTLADTIAWLHRRLPAARFVVPAASAELGTIFQTHCRRAGVAGQVRIVAGRARAVLRAADVALVTSGTATLETMLLGTPFVALYRAAPFTAWLMRNAGLLKIPQVAMPNILAGAEVAPEFLQEAADAPLLGAAVYQMLTRPHLRAHQEQRFRPICRSLHRATSATAASAVFALCAQE